MPKQQPTQKQSYEAIGKMVASIYESGYANKSQTLKMSFIKGVVSGLGGVIGATLVVALLAWILTLFDTVPFVNTLTKTIKQTIIEQ